jgi:hypothetical protein
LFPYDREKSVCSVCYSEREIKRGRERERVSECVRERERERILLHFAVSVRFCCEFSFHFVRWRKRGRGERGREGYEKYKKRDRRKE